MVYIKSDHARPDRTLATCVGEKQCGGVGFTRKGFPGSDYRYQEPFCQLMDSSVKPDASDNVDELS
jgi:hypothetical protein